MWTMAYPPGERRRARSHPHTPQLLRCYHNCGRKSIINKVISCSWCKQEIVRLKIQPCSNVIRTSLLCEGRSLIPRPCSLAVFNKRSKPGGREGLGTRLVAIFTMATNLEVEWQPLGCWRSCCFRPRSLLELAPHSAPQMLGSKQLL